MDVPELHILQCNQCTDPKKKKKKKYPLKLTNKSFIDNAFISLALKPAKQIQIFDM